MSAGRGRGWFRSPRRGRSAEALFPRTQESPTFYRSPACWLPATGAVEGAPVWTAIVRAADDCQASLSSLVRCLGVREGSQVDTSG
jgi:hypothetical protein